MPSFLVELLGSLNQATDERELFHALGEACGKHCNVSQLLVLYERQPDEPALVLWQVGEAEPATVEAAAQQLSQRWKRKRGKAKLPSPDSALRIVQAGPDSAAPAPGFEEQFSIVLGNQLFAMATVLLSELPCPEFDAQQGLKLALHMALLHLKTQLLQMDCQQLQTKDSLTGMYSERHFFSLMEREFERAARYQVALSLIFIDVDHFKDVNEAYGYETGNSLLADISRIVAENMRNTDFCSRYSGERFVVVLPETPCQNAEIMANRLRRYIENHSFFMPQTNAYLKVTVSIGVAGFLEHFPGSLAQFIEFADTALYFAKRNGRNQVVNYSYVLSLMVDETQHES